MNICILKFKLDKIKNIKFRRVLFFHAYTCTCFLYVFYMTRVYPYHIFLYIFICMLYVSKCV